MTARSQVPAFPGLRLPPAAAWSQAGIRLGCGPRLGFLPRLSLCVHCTHRFCLWTPVVPHVAQTPAGSQGPPSDTLTRGSLGFEDQGATASFSKCLHQKQDRHGRRPQCLLRSERAWRLLILLLTRRPWQQPQEGSVSRLRSQGLQVKKPRGELVQPGSVLAASKLHTDRTVGQVTSIQVNNSQMSGQWVKMEASSPSGGEPRPKHWGLGPQGSPPSRRDRPRTHSVRPGTTD